MLLPAKATDRATSEISFVSATRYTAPNRYDSSSDFDYLDDIVEEEGYFNWPKESFPIRVFIKPGEGVPGFRANYPDIVRQSFDQWSMASAGKLSWIEVAAPDKAQIVCDWTGDPRELESGTEAGNTKTYTIFNTQTNHGIISRATMSLATRLPDRLLTDQEVEKTFLHEVGHAFGLAGHSPLRSDIMFASVSSKQSSILTHRDRATINRLYEDYPIQRPLVTGQRQPVSLRG